MGLWFSVCALNWLQVSLVRLVGSLLTRHASISCCTDHSGFIVSLVIHIHMPLIRQC